MGKRKYRAIDVKKFDWKELCDQVRGKRIVVGVDVAKEAMVAAALDSSETVLKTVRWSHPTETSNFVSFAKALSESAEKVEFAMEPSGVYGDALRWQLVKDGFSVFRVSPKKSHDMAEVHDGVPSFHDAKSAAIVAVLHFRKASDPWPFDTDEKRRLSAALWTLEVFAKQFRQNRNRLEALTARHWPELTAHLDLGTATLLTLLAEYGGPERVVADEAGARDLMRRVGGTMLDSSKIEAVIASAGKTTGLPQIEEEVALVRGIAAEAQRNRKAEREARQRVESLAIAGGSTEKLAPVVGKTTAAVVVAGVGDPCSFESPKALVKAAGLNLRERSSGKKKGGLHITKRGSGVARLYLWMAALRAIKADPVVRAWYAKKIKRQGGTAKAKAVVAVMRKLVLALWHVARGHSFDPTKLFDVRRLDLGSPSDETPKASHDAVAVRKTGLEGAGEEVPAASDSSGATAAALPS